MMKDLFKVVNSEWVAPSEYPDLSTHDKVAIDLETCDPELVKEGPGWPIRRGKVIGIAISSNGFTGYYPIDHDGGGNMDKKTVLSYVKSLCENENLAKVFHNAQYDIGWLSTLDIEVKGRIHDTMIATALINENRYTYKLNSIVFDYLGERKNETKLKEAADAFGVDAKSEMYKLPAQFVGEYAEADARLTLKLHEKLSWEITKDNLETVYDIECKLINVIFNMTKRGVRFDVERCLSLLSLIHI